MRFVTINLLWLFVLIPGANKAGGDITENTPEAKAAFPGTTVVANYAGAAYFYGEGTLWNSLAEANDIPDSLGTFSQLFPNDTSRFLYARDFNFDLPCNATITNVTVRITRQNNTAVDVRDALVSLFNPNTISPGSLNLADPSIWVEGGTDWETITYSHANWGETLTPEMLNSDRFGVLLQVEHLLTSGLARAYVDAIEIEVCYNVGTPYTDPITFTTIKEDACFNEGSITVQASGGSGSYEYSIDDGMNWQSGNSFTNLGFGDYIIMVRNDDGTCETERFYCNLSGDDRILQPGDVLLACATFPGNQVTLAIEKLQPLNELYNLGETGYDISFLIPVHPYEWTVTDLQGEVFSFAIDSIRNIYTATTILYDLVPGVAISPYVQKIDAFTANVTTLDTLPGDSGATGVEYDSICQQLFIGNLSDGIIYRLDPDTGAELSTFDPGAADNGAAGMAPLGERILGLGWNHIEERLYYAVWASDFNKTGIRNTIRSIAIDPVTCDFLPGTDQLEVTLPWTSEYGDPTNPEDYSMPVGDIEFSTDGGTMLLGETGFDSSVPRSQPHEARMLRYLGSSGSWTLQTTVPPGNTYLQHELGEVSAGLNSRGGVDFANSGIDSMDCTIDQDSFVIASADALRGADCNTLGCLYGLQYMPVTGGNSMGSVLMDVARNAESQQKSVFGDVDVIQGCQTTYFCCPDVSSTAPDTVICVGENLNPVDVESQADSMALVYFTIVPADSVNIYSAGTYIDTTALTAGSGTLDFSNFSTATPGTYYFYTVVYPAPQELYCRPYDSLVVTISTGANVMISDPADRCIDGADMNFTGSPLPGGSTSGVFTTTAGSGLTDFGNGMAVLDISAAGIGVHEVIYAYTDALGCTVSDTTSVEIFPLPVVSLNDPLDECVSGSDMAFTGSPLPSGGASGVFSTSASAGLTDNGDGTAVLDVSAAGSGVYDVIYSYTDSLGCTANDTVSVTIYSQPAVGLTGPTSDCVVEGPMNFTGFPSPASGISGVFNTTAPAGLTDNGDGTAILDVGAAGAGMYDITYRFTDNNGCTDSSTLNIEIWDTLAFVDLDQATVCGNAAFGPNSVDLNTLILSGPSGGSWADTDGSGGLSGSVFTADPSMEGSSFTFSYTITGSGPAGTACGERTFSTEVEVVPCNLDMALIISTSQSTPVSNGDLVSFQITVCNQGLAPVDSVELITYPGSCYSFTPNNNWSLSGSDLVRTLSISNGELPAGGLPPLSASPGNCLSFDLDLTVICSDITGLINYAEINAARDSLGNTADIDSSPGSDSPGERSVLPGSPEDDSFSDTTEDDHDPVTVPLVDVALAKTLVSTAPFAYGQTVIFNLQVFNQGNLELRNIELTDYIPCGFTYSSNNDPQWSASGSNATTQIAALPVSQDTSVLLELILEEWPGGCARDSAWLNEAEVSMMFDTSFTDVSAFDYDSNSDNSRGNDAGGASGTGSDDSTTGDGTGMPGDGDPATDEDDHDPMLFELYDLALSKAELSSSPYSNDSIVIYNITVENQGNMDAGSIEFIDTPESGLIYLGSDASSNPNITETGPGVWLIDSLFAGATESLTLSYQISMAFGGNSLTNTAMITTDDGDDIDSDPAGDENTDEDGDGDGFDDDEDSVTIPVQPSYDLSLTKSEFSTGPYFQGSTVRFEVIVTNEGPVTAFNTRIEDAPGAGLIFTGDDSGSNPNVTALGGMVYEIQSLSPGASESIIIDFEINATYQGDSINNFAQIILDDGDDRDSDPSTDETVDEDGDGDGFDDDEDEITVPVAQTYDLALEKTVLPGGFFPGGMVTFEITITNEGSLDASSVNITELPSPFLNYDSDNSNSDPDITRISPTLYTVSNLSQNSSKTFRITYLIDTGVSGSSIENIAVISQDDGDDIDSDPTLDHTVDEDGDLDPYDDDEDNEIIDITYGYDLGNYVWHDLDGDGIQDFNEPGIGGVTVQLYTATGFFVGQKTTDASGSYLFELVYPGNYYIKILAGNEFQPTLFDKGGNDNLDSDITGENGPFTTDIFTLANHDYSRDAGLIDCADICGVVWLDFVENDVRDNFENGLNQLIVELYKFVNGQWLLWETDQTGLKPGTPSDDGYFEFCVVPGTYHLKFLNPPTTLVTVIPNRGSDENRDSDVTGTYGPGTTAQFTVTSGGSKCDIGAGYYPMGTIGDYVWNDNNQNGMRDAGEQGVAGVVVMAVDIEGDLVSFTSTDNNGKYIVDYLGKNDYYLQFNLPGGYSLTVPNVGLDSVDSDVDHSNGPFTTPFYSVSPGQHVPNVDAGLISGPLAVVWQDILAENRNDHNYIRWTVSREQNVSHYVVERAINDISGFSQIDTIEVAQNSLTEKIYEYADRDISEEGVYYYRIKQVDYDGRFSYSKIVSVNLMQDSESLTWQIFPNPVYEELTIEMKIENSFELLTGDIYDDLGQLVRKNILYKENVLAGEHKFTIKPEPLATGIYTLKISLDEEFHTAQFIFIN